jgi:hypothetical protein
LVVALMQTLAARREFQGSGSSQLTLSSDGLAVDPWSIRYRRHRRFVDQPMTR